MIAFDFAQDLQFPHFGEEQPGDIFYFSPLNRHAFGTLNHSLEHDQMHEDLNQEWEGKKGANNVASLIK